MSVQSKLIVGLGNPPAEYENTRHNVGFVILDEFSKKHKISNKQDKDLLCSYGKGKFLDHNLIVAWPTTFVNKSGDAVVRLMKWFKLKTDNLIVVHDDVALKFGKIRISFNSGAAGHHGVESIIQMLGGDKGFCRLRVGVGPDPGGDERRDYVLTKFTNKEKKLLKKVVALSSEAIETLITKDPYEAMNQFNGIELK